jgi:hypothetical protein
MRAVLILLISLPLVSWGQQSRKVNELTPPKGTNVIYVHSPQTDPETYRLVLQILQKAKRPIEQQDSLTGRIRTGIFTLTPNYDVQMDLLVRQGRVRISGSGYNRVGQSERAACGAPMGVSSSAFGHLNYFAHSLTGRLKYRKMEYLREQTDDDR